MQGITLTTEELRKLLSCGCPEAAVLYLYRRAGNPPETALDALHLTATQMQGALQCLRQLGLWDAEKPTLIQPERPVYTDEDLRIAMRDKRSSFQKLVGEAQRQLGRVLSTEELKTLLSCKEYLRLPDEVVGLLLSFCVERSRRRGSRAPSMRSIEKEAYRWSDENIDNLESASYYVQQQLLLHTRIERLRLQLQLEQRRLTTAEEQYLSSWMLMGFPDSAIHLAYEKTCNNTGGLKWAYMNSILKSWHEKGLHTPTEITTGDIVPVRTATRRGNEIFSEHNAPLSRLEKAAVARALAEEQED